MKKTLDVQCLVIAVMAVGAFALRAGAGGEPLFVQPLPPVTSTLYADGRHVSVNMQRVARYVCGSETRDHSATDLQRVIDWARLRSATPLPLASRTARTGFNLVLVEAAPVSPSVRAAMDAAEDYVETLFLDPVTIYVELDIRNLGSGVLGVTMPTFVSMAWPDIRAGLVHGMDLTDTIQFWLPLTTYVPVRFDGVSPTVTPKGVLELTHANFVGTIGKLPPDYSATILLNEIMPWDFDPSDGIDSETFCFQSILLHEIGHVLGFLSGTGTAKIYPLDLFRFQRSDGLADWNPDTLQEFQSTPRTVSFNSPDDDANSDLVVVEYAMSDGEPYQGSHFREEEPTLGLMDPSGARNESYSPDFFRDADLAMLDAIGWDDAAPDCNGNGVSDFDDIAEDPSLDCQNDSIMDACQLIANDCNSNAIPDDCDVLYDDCDFSDVPDSCELAGNDCNVNQILDECDAWELYRVLVGPVSQFRCSGQDAVFTVGAPAESTFHWFKDDQPLTDGAGYLGTSTDTLTILSVDLADSGYYRCVVTQGCITTSGRWAYLTVANTQLAAAQQPVAQVTLCASAAQSAVFTFRTDNQTGVSYQWFHDGTELSNDGRISGVRTSNLSIERATASDTGTYTCRATSTCGAVIFSDPTRGKLFVVGAAFEGQPQATCTSAGGQARFQARVDASPSTQYFWYRNGEFLTNGTDAAGMVVSGANTRLLKLNNVPATYNGQSFQLVTFVSSPTCIGQSDLATLTVGATCGPCRFAGDLDGDLDADLKDMAIFATCLGMPATGACACANADADNAVIDLADWDAMEVRMNGPS